MIVKIKTDNKELPFYATEGSAGMDLRAKIDKNILLKPLDRAIIPTGIYIQLPDGYEAQIRPRSGLAAKYGITVLNAPGTIDSDYINEIGVILCNLSHEDFVIKPNDRIAQMVIAKYEKITWEKVDELTQTDRKGGFGSTGIS